MRNTKDIEGAFWIRGRGRIQTEPDTSPQKDGSVNIEQISKKAFLRVSLIGAGAALAYAIHPFTEKLGLGRIIRQLAGHP